MPIETLNPSGLLQVDTYRQAAVATGSRTVYVAGQVAAPNIRRYSRLNCEGLE